ncbi:MAG TPA: PorV/PorQ family protein [bacterium]|nr:PorV/PorQ family protein [bacterium]
MKRLSMFVLVIMIFTAPHGFAGVELVGTTSSNFLKIPPFARAAGMGEAFTAVSDGTYGLYYNPAGLVSVTGFEVQFSHISWFQSINYEYLALVTPVPYTGLGRLGFAFAWFQVDEMDKTSALPDSFINNPESHSSYDFSPYMHYKFAPFNYSVVLAYGIDIKEYLAAGASLKLASENIDTSSGVGITTDIGLMYKSFMHGHSVKLGLVLSNFGSDLKLENTAFEPPRVLKTGISDSFSMFGGTLLISAQIILQLDYDNLYSLGAEYLIYDMVALRFGYKLGAFDQPSFGAGVKWKGIGFDYAFIRYEELGMTHRFSLNYSWGTPPVSLEVNPPVFSPNNDKYMDDAAFTPVFKSKDRLKSVVININDPLGVRVRSIEIKDLSSQNVLWDGRGETGVLADGVYWASLVANYENGTSVSAPVSVEIDNTPPVMRIDAQPQLLRPGQNDALLIPSTISLFADDRNSVSKWQLTVWDKDKKPFFTTDGNGPPPPSFIWDGKGNSGEYVTTGEIYYYSLSATDTLGNRGQTPAKAQVVLLKEIKLSFASDALFDLGKADVKISAYGILKEMKKVIEENPNSTITVAGHTDNLRPSGGIYRTNKELSKARADAVKFFMVNLLSMDGSRINTAGYGEEHPIASNNTPDGRAQNRRVEIIIESTIYR